MTQKEFRMGYLREIHRRYGKASRKKKTEILAEFVKNCRYNRKYAIRILNAPLQDERKAGKPRRQKYSEKAIKILEMIWEKAGYPWSVRLKAMLPDWMPSAKKRYDIDPKTEQELLAISPRQMDRRLGPKRLKMRRRIYGTTKPGALLKNQIPIRTKNWDIKKAGYVEIDTVAHCGNSLEGDFIYTLNQTDIHTTWTEQVAVMGKGAYEVQQGVEEMRRRLPFDLKGIDSDNGSEFINYHLLSYCLQFKPPLDFTHSRPYEKEDQGHVEQKNFTHVRKMFGWDRYDTLEVKELMNDLYRNELHLWQNLFQPSVKLKKKVRKGSRIIRKYDEARTPFRRVLACKQSDPQKTAVLQKLFETIDPFELSERLDQKLQRIYRKASQRVGNRMGLKPLPLNSKTPKKLWNLSKKCRTLDHLFVQTQKDRAA